MVMIIVKIMIIIKIMLMIVGGGTGGSEPPASRTLLSHFPCLYVPAPAWTCHKTIARERAKTRDEVPRRERKSTCSACGILNLICILLARKNGV